MDFFKSFFDISKLPTKIFLVLSIVTGVFIFSDEVILKQLQLNKFNKYGAYVGIIFLFSTVLVIVNFIIWIFRKIHIELKLHKLKKEYKEVLENLDPHEKAVLREFFIQRQSSLEMPYDNPVISGLLDKNILKINKQFGSSFIMHGTKISVSISKYFYKIIRLEHLDLKENLTEEEQEYFLQNRPDWLSSRWRY